MNLQQERWAQMVSDVSEYGFSGDAFVVSQLNARKLLARQHAAVVRVLKRQQRFYIDPRGNLLRDEDGSLIMYDDILDALVKQGGKQ